MFCGRPNELSKELYKVAGWLAKNKKEKLNLFFPSIFEDLLKHLSKGMNIQ